MTRSPPALAAASITRRHEIDGIRGWAAIVVLGFHVVWESFGELHPALRNDAFSVLFNGPLAVAVFFVLSGDALSSSFLRSGDRRLIDALVLKRYFRLTVPIALSCALTYLLMKLGWAYHVEAAQIVNDHSFLPRFLLFEASVETLVKYSAFLVYATPDTEISYNPFLWPMAIELIGSMLVFLYLYVHPSLKRPGLVVAMLALLLFLAPSYLGLFFVGVGFGLLANNGVLDRLRDSARWAWVSLLALVAVVAIANFRIGSASSLREHMLIASELVFLLYSNRWTMRLLGTPLSRFVGRISFPLYLVHFSIIVSLMSYLVIRFHAAGALTPWAVATICTITIAVSIAAAAVFERVETRTLHGVYAALASIRRPP